ncbi:MAG: hypothetical protein LBL99_04500, partial [Holosporaceae bacterium]|nr:hypothetical protein [Holosporaceae bacterium]
MNDLLDKIKSKTIMVSDNKKKSPRGKRSKCAVLIEFTICVPVLIMCLVAMYDMPKYYQIQADVKFCALCGMNMIQNVSMNRANKRITLNDISRIFIAASLPYFGGGARQYR